MSNVKPSKTEEQRKTIRDFYIILVGIVLSYFVGVAINYGTPTAQNDFITASPITIAKFLGHLVYGEPPVDMDSLWRSVGLVVLALSSVVLDGYGLTRYDNLLEKKGRINLGWEMLQVLFFLSAPLFLLEAVSPNLSLRDYPKTEFSLEIVAAITGVILWSEFLLRTSERFRRFL